MSNDSNTWEVKINMDGDAEARELRHNRLLACMSGVATGLLVATVVFFVFYDRAELQFLFSKPAAQATTAAPAVATATPANTVAINK